jgi:hypothetical protein
LFSLKASKNFTRKKGLKTSPKDVPTAEEPKSNREEEIAAETGVITTGIKKGGELRLSFILIQLVLVNK